MSGLSMAELARRGLTMDRRARLKRELKTGEVHLADLLADPPEWALGMRLFDVLRSLPRVHRRKSQAALRALQASELTTLGGLSDRQQRLLLDHFQARHPSLWALWGVMAGRNGR